MIFSNQNPACYFEKNNIEYMRRDALMSSYTWLSNDAYGLIVMSEKRHGVSRELIASVIQEESWVRGLHGSRENQFKHKTRAHGPARKVSVYENNVIVWRTHRARGLMQIMPFHSKEPDRLWDAEYNIMKGTSILKECRNLRGSDYGMLQCYNSGRNSKKVNKEYINNILSRVKNNS